MKESMEVDVYKENSEIVTTSKNVAEVFGKEHKNVLQSIESLMSEDGLKNQPMFQESTYEDVYGRNKKMYIINRDGFSLLCMGFTGSKALSWKLKYIEAFNLMEKKLTESEKLSEKDRLTLLLFSKDKSVVASAYNQLVELETAPLIKTIEEQKPLVSFANTVSISSSSIDMNEMAKLCRKEGLKIGRNRLFEVLRDNKILMSNNTPYQKFIDNGSFELIETVKHTSYGDKLFPKTMVKGKGQIKIVKMLKEMNL